MIGLLYGEKIMTIC